MGIFLDIVLLAILLLSIFLGYRKGLIGVVFNLCAFFVSLIITLLLYNPITNLVISKTQIDDKIQQTIIENGITEEDTESTKTNQDEKIIYTYINKYITDSAISAKNDVIESTAQIIAEKIVSIIVAITLFVVVRIALILLKFLAEGIASLPIIKQFNEVGGIAYGILRGIILVYLILAVAFFIVSINNNITIINAIDSSILTKLLYNNNIILNIIF